MIVLWINTILPTETDVGGDAHFFYLGGLVDFGKTHSGKAQDRTPYLFFIMVERKLINHFKRLRKQHRLSQQDIAFLIGVNHISKISRYERLAQMPTLPTVIAYEIIFHMPVRKLFPDLTREIHIALKKRALDLSRTLASKPSDEHSTYKITLLKSIYSVDDNATYI